jgi:hypothetical protein
LKAERNRRIAAKVESGELKVTVIGVPPAGDEPSSADGDLDAPITAIYTGVPRSPDFNKWERVDMPPQYPDRYATTQARRAAPSPRPPVVPTEWKWFHVTVTPPSERDVGMIIEGRYQIAGAELRLDFQGRIYAEPIGPNDDPLAAARRLLRSKYGRHGEFNAPIHYPSRSFH